MVSRKRNKGKQRKAKKAEKEVEIERAEMRQTWQSLVTGEFAENNNIHMSKITCNHGFDVTVILNKERHPVSCFMDTLFTNSMRKDITMGSLANLRDTFQLHPAVWNNASHRQMARNLLVCIGTNSLLLLQLETDKGIHTSTDDFRFQVARYLTDAIMVLENYHETAGDIDLAIYSRTAGSKRRDKMGVNVMRDLLKLYSKRITCSCLKKMYSEARKTLPKVGSCGGCAKVMERSSLMVCSKCRVDQYCCRECQVTAWPEHKESCELYEGNG